MPSILVPKPEPLPDMKVRCPTCGKVMPGGEYGSHYAREHVPPETVRPRP
jgi:hypothetical protein